MKSIIGTIVNSRGCFVGGTTRDHSSPRNYVGHGSPFDNHDVHDEPDDGYGAGAGYNGSRFNATTGTSGNLP